MYLRVAFTRCGELRAQIATRYAAAASLRSDTAGADGHFCGKFNSATVSLVGICTASECRPESGSAVDHFECSRGSQNRYVPLRMLCFWQLAVHGPRYSAVLSP